MSDIALNFNYQHRSPSPNFVDINGYFGDSEMLTEFTLVSSKRSQDQGDSDFSRITQSSNTRNTTYPEWANETMRLIEKGDLHEVISYLSLCLDYNQNLRSRKVNIPQDILCLTARPRIDELSLLEKRCLIYMKLKMYEKVPEDVRRMLDIKPTHAMAFKCIIAAHCKMNKLDHVAEVLKLWKRVSPNDLEMIECRTKVENLIKAVQNGIEPASAFLNIEDMLGLKYDWLLRKRLIDSNWRYRPVPPGNSQYVLCLQFRFGHCSLGERCTDAHSEEELEEWKKRAHLLNITNTMNSVNPSSASGMAYVKSVLEEVEATTILDSQSGDKTISLPLELNLGVSVSSLEPLKTLIRTMKPYLWKFKVDSRARPLTHVCLLYEIHRPYFKISNAYFNGAQRKLNLLEGKDEEHPARQILEITPTTSALLGHSEKTPYSYTFEIKFQPEVFGTFRQTIVFDFDNNSVSQFKSMEKTKVVRELTVDVTPLDEESEHDEPVENQVAGNMNDKKDKTETFISPTRSASRTGKLSSSIRGEGATWNFGNADIVDGFNGLKVCSTKIGFALIHGHGKGPADMPKTEQEQLTRYNYKEKMRYFLTQEERARQEILSKYNISAHLTLMGKYEMKSGLNEGMVRYAVDNTLFARMVLFRDVSEDTAVGRLILRNCNNVLISKSEDVRNAEENGRKPKVYLCSIIEKTKNAMYFELGDVICTNLNLNESDIALFDIQFQLDRTSFMEQKMVIDLIEEIHLDMLFPNFEQEPQIPWNPLMQWNSTVETDRFRLNPKQKESLIAVTAENMSPPILIIGPFGTGKTFTLAQCIKTILGQKNTKILVCTHSNSAADLYVKDYLDPLTSENKEAKPLRIYFAMRNLATVHPNVLKYCLVENGRFKPPSKENILSHRIIVVTLSTSFELIRLNLDTDTFSHILLDEAAQAMESEAITPILAAGKNTKLVLAGDYMQLSNELFSSQSKLFHASLLERLHCHYPENSACKLMLCENYRSHSAIIQFASDSFYQNKLKCGKVQPTHSSFYPLVFCCARGEDIQDQDSTSYYNMAEVFELCEKVSEVVSSWPESWGDWRDENAIGVLTAYPDQVTRIRARLRKKGLGSISVERVLNVQGKQFRACFISTVRTSKPWIHILPKTVGHQIDLGFFSNPKLLNTALTRAQSLVMVVGDPVSLCSLGKCRLLWKDFIQICHENKSLFGMSYTQIQQSILGTELRLTWGLNPLANEFEPLPLPLPKDGLTSSIMYNKDINLLTTTLCDENFESTSCPQADSPTDQQNIEPEVSGEFSTPIDMTGLINNYASQCSIGPNSQPPSLNYPIFSGPPHLTRQQPRLIAALPPSHENVSRPSLFVYPTIPQAPMFRPAGPSAFASYFPLRQFQRPLLQRIPRPPLQYIHPGPPPYLLPNTHFPPSWGYNNMNLQMNDPSATRNNYNFAPSQLAGIPLQRLPQQHMGPSAFDYRPAYFNHPYQNMGGMPMSPGPGYNLSQADTPSQFYAPPNPNAVQNFSSDEILYMKRAIEHYAKTNPQKLNAEPFVDDKGCPELERVESLRQKLTVAVSGSGTNDLVYSSPHQYQTNYNNSSIGNFGGPATDPYGRILNPINNTFWRDNQAQMTKNDSQIINHSYPVPGLGKHLTNTTGFAAAYNNNNIANNITRFGHDTQGSFSTQMCPPTWRPATTNENSAVHSITSSSGVGRSYANVVKTSQPSEITRVQSIEAETDLQLDDSRNKSYNYGVTTTNSLLPLSGDRSLKPATSRHIVPLMSVAIPLSLTLDVRNKSALIGGTTTTKLNATSGTTKKMKRRKKL